MSPRDEATPRETRSANLNTFKAMPAVSDYRTAGFDHQMAAAAPVPATLKRKIALVGSASSSSGKAPWTDKSWEIWGLAWRMNDMKRYDRLFEIHRRDTWQSCQGGDAKVLELYTAALQKMTVPVYLYKSEPDIPAGVVYPLEDIYAVLGRKYLSSSIGYMLAMAVLEQARDGNIDEVALWGIDLLCEDEFQEQRPNTDWLVGRLEGMGVKVLIPEESAICKMNYLYGIEDTPSEGPINSVWIAKRIEEYDQKQKQSAEAFHATSGAARALGLMVSPPEAATDVSDKEFTIKLALTAEQKALLAEKQAILNERGAELLGMAQAIGGASQFGRYIQTMLQHYKRGGVVPG